jgi:hypothetical protein
MTLQNDVAYFSYPFSFDLLYVGGVHEKQGNISRIMFECDLYVLHKCHPNLLHGCFVNAVILEV